MRVLPFAGVIIDITSEQLDRVFTYRIPEHLQQVLRIGMQVKVPFGRGNKERTAYVVSLSEEAPDANVSYKEITDVAAEGIPIEGNLIELASWMARNYGSTTAQALRTVLPAKQKIQHLKKRSVTLALPKEEAEAFLLEAERKHHTARARLIRELLAEETIPYEVVTQKLHITADVMRALSEKGIIEVSEEDAFRRPAAPQGGTKKEPLRLTPAQQAMSDRIRSDLRKEIYKTYLLFGVTGSGKTEVYMKAIEEVTALGGQAIVLIPEIALTYQTVMRFYDRFGDRVSVMHSRLSKGERYDQFRLAKEGKLDVVIGPRSALFTPFPNLKLIVIDEEHEMTYKSELSPRYHARETAIHRAETEGASVVLGSATPSLEAYSRALSGEYELLELPGRVSERPLPRVHTVDLREEMKAGNRSVISRLLDEKIRGRLERGEQVMLFLNRRGYAGTVICRECGHVMTCPHCDVSLSQHLGGMLSCHYCGYETKMPEVCPSCKSPHIQGIRAGTEQIERLLKARYEGARVLRMDMDSTRGKEGHARILSAFAGGEADILLGTQMIVKGHDFPNVTLVGILAADMSLFAGDFRSAERTFQLLTQAAGRAGRGEKPGEVVVQTYQPEHYAIRHAVSQDYRGFYEEEYAFRDMMSYPPAAHMLSVTLTGPDEEKLATAASYVRMNSEAYAEKLGAEVFGPGSPYIGKAKDLYRKVLFYKSPKYDTLVKIKDYLNAYIEINSGFRGMQTVFDFNG